MTRIFITGGLGFIGQSIISVLKPNEIIVYDQNVNSFRRESEEYDGVRIIQGDILDVEHLTQSMKNCDVVIHLAAYMNSDLDINHYIKGANININGTLNVVHAMKTNNIKKLIFFSSSFVYGNTPDNGTVESGYKNPHTGYGVSKLAGEGLLGDVDYVILRPSIICGKYDWYGQSISIFIKQALVNGFIKIYKGAEHVTRDYVYSLDVAQFVKLIVDKDLFTRKVYNISSNEAVSTHELAKKIGKILDVEVIIDTQKTSNTFLKTLNLDNSNASELYKFKKLDEYLPSYLEWARNNHETYW